MREWAKNALLASRVLRLAAEVTTPSVAILMYHAVQPEPVQYIDSLGAIIHSESTFRHQMEMLAGKYHPISLHELTSKIRDGNTLSGRSVVVTFDDGYSDNYDVAMPILNQLGIPAAFYATVDCIENKRLPWPSR